MKHLARRLSRAIYASSSPGVSSAAPHSRIVSSDSNSRVSPVGSYPMAFSTVSNPGVPSPLPIGLTSGFVTSSPRFTTRLSPLLGYGASSLSYSLPDRRFFFSKGKDSKDSDADFSFKGKDSNSMLDSSKEDVQAVSKEIVDVANDTFSSLKEISISSITWIQETTENLLPIIKEKFEILQYYASSEISPQLFYTSLGTLLAWFVMPRILRSLHRYFEDGSHIILGRSVKIPFEESFWSAMEDPAKTLITVLAFSQIASLLAPDTIGTLHVEQIWKGTALFSLVWFLHRWKSNRFARLISDPSLSSVEKERIYTLDRISSMGLFVLGGMSIAETCGIAVQSILTVGGVGGVATAFAARDILGNLLSGFSLQFMKPFSIGDTIKAGSVEGQVVNIGLTATQLLDNDKFPVIVPNSFFSSQVIVNKSRATWRSFSLRIPVQLSDFDKIPEITRGIQSMLRAHSKVTLHSGPPLCYASQVSGPALEISIVCNLLFEGREDLLSCQQDITLQSLKIVSAVGATFSYSGSS